MKSCENIINKYCSPETYKKINLDTSFEYDNNKPTLLVVDDQETVIILFKKLLKRMKLLDKFNIVMLSGTDVVSKIFKLLIARQDITIDIVISDVTFGGYVVVDDGAVSYDGVQLVGILKEIYPNLLYRFLTGHSVAKDSTPWIYEEYSKYASDDILEYISLKDKLITSNRDIIYKTVKGTKYEKMVESSNGV